MREGNVPTLTYVYTCLNPTCGTQSTGAAMPICKNCKSVQISMKLVLQSDAPGDCTPFPPEKDARHSLVEYDLDD